jgi:hypothetical protein
MWVHRSEHAGKRTSCHAAVGRGRAHRPPRRHRHECTGKRTGRRAIAACGWARAPHVAVLSCWLRAGDHAELWAGRRHAKLWAGYRRLAPPCWPRERELATRNKMIHLHVGPACKEVKGDIIFSQSDKSNIFLKLEFLCSQFPIITL